MYKCKVCGRELSSNDKICPDCHATNPSFKVTGEQESDFNDNDKKILRGIVIGILVLLFGFWMFWQKNLSGEAAEKK